MSWPKEKSVITHLRVRGNWRDALTTQLITERVLNSVSFQPTGLPSSSILCIRSLRDPKPSSLRLQADNLRPSTEWESAVSARIDQLAREAARPIDGAVPASAQAVIFKDRTEFLACLAADWCVGNLIVGWWWQSFLQGRDIDRAVIEAWMEAPEHIPMALHWLEVKRLAVSLMQKLSDDGSHKMMSILVQTYGLYEMLPLINQGATGNSARLRLAPNSKEIKAVADAPWRPWVQGNSVDQLSFDRQLLLGVGLMLHRAPSIVRTASFAKQVQDWQTSVDHFQRDVPMFESQSPKIEQPRTLMEQSPLEANGLAESLLDADTPHFDSTQEIIPASRIAQISATEENILQNPTEIELGKPGVKIDSEFSLAVDTASGLSTDRLTIGEKKVGPTNTGEVTPVEGTEVVKESSFFEIAERLVMDQSSISEENEYPLQTHREPDIYREDIERSDIEIESQFGGICYFINLGLYLNFYGDFTKPLQPGIELPIWDFVVLIGLQIIGDQIVHDPIWSLCAQLAGRTEDEPPGLHFDPPGHESLQTWLDELMSSVRARLQAGFGVDHERLPLFFMRPARIVVSPTHLDVYLSLAELPIEIRLSGLDRDPGWVPAAGKFVAFHYD